MNVVYKPQLVPPEFRAPAKEVARQLKERRLRRGLALFGPTGIGKTVLARRIYQLAARSYPSFFVSWLKVLERREEEEALWKFLEMAQVLVLDDFSVAARGRFGQAEELADAVVNEVYEKWRWDREGFLLIVTSNATPQDVEAALDGRMGISWRRVFDRLREMCVVVFADGPSKRGER